MGPIITVLQKWHPRAITNSCSEKFRILTAQKGRTKSHHLNGEWCAWWWSGKTNSADGIAIRRWTTVSAYRTAEKEHHPQVNVTAWWMQTDICWIWLIHEKGGLREPPCEISTQGRNRLQNDPWRISSHSQSLHPVRWGSVPGVPSDHTASTPPA